MAISDLEKQILAAGEKILSAARKGALEVRKSKLVQELEDIEADLAALVGKEKPTSPATKTEEKPKPAARKPKAS